MSTDVNGKDRLKFRRKYNQIFLSGEMNRTLARASKPEFQITMVGSFGSHVTILGSDADLLFELKNILIEESALEFREDLPVYLKVDLSILTLPLPANLKGDGRYLLADPIRDLTHQLFNAHFPWRGESKVGKTYGSGEMSNSYGLDCDIDLVPQIKLSCFPRTAQSFVTRPRLWPSEEVMSIIISGDFHITARPAPIDQDSSHDFCLSFSKAEVILLRALSADQICCIKIVKVLKPVIDNGRNILTSYHLKSTAFWYFEEHGDNATANKRAVFGILQKLDEFLADGSLPHYFVPKMNLLSDFSNDDISVIRNRLRGLLGILMTIPVVPGIAAYENLIYRIINMDEMLRDSSINAAFLPEEFYTFSTCFVEVFEWGRNLYAKSSKAGSDGTSPLKITFDLSSKHAESLLSRIIQAHPNQLLTLATDFTFALMLETWESIAQIIDAWMNGRNLTWKPDIHGFEALMKSANRAVHMEPLDEFFPIELSPTPTGISNERLEKECEFIMKKWLSFTDKILQQMKSHVEKVMTKIKVGMWIRNNFHEISRIMTQIQLIYSRTRCTDKDIDLMFHTNDVTADMLSSASDLIEEFSHFPNSMKLPVRSFPYRSSHTEANLMLLDEAIQILYIYVEHSALLSIRSKTMIRGEDAIKLPMEGESLNAVLVIHKALARYEKIIDHLRREFGSIT